MSILVTESLKKSNVSLLWSVINGKYQPDRAWRSQSFCLKFLLRCGCYPVVSYRYLRALTGFDSFPELLERQGLLPAKIHRPYLQAGLDVRHRAAAIVSHYELLCSLENPCLQNFLLQRTARPLLEWTTDKGHHFMLNCGPAQFDREGEVMLCLHYQQQIVAMVTFSLISRGEQPVLFIGGLQGPSGEGTADRVRQATRDACGIFPKRLLIEAVSLLAAACGVSAIMAVSEHSHVFRSLRYRRSKQDKFFSSYSSFWESLGGVRESGGLYTLPMKVIRKPLEEVASKKRAEYRRRYQLLEALEQQFMDALGITAPL